MRVQSEQYPLGIVPPMSTTTASPARSTRADGTWCGFAALGPDPTITKSARAWPCATISPAMSAATSCSVRPGRSQPGTRSCTRSMAAPASRSAAISAGLLRSRRPRSAAPASAWRVPGSASRSRSTISAHICSARPAEEIPASRWPTMRNGSSVSSQLTISRSMPAAGDAWAEASSSRGTTRNAGPRAGTARQVSRSLGCVSYPVR